MVFVFVKVFVFVLCEGKTRFHPCVVGVGVGSSALSASVVAFCLRKTDSIFEFSPAFLILFIRYLSLLINLKMLIIKLL